MALTAFILAVYMVSCGGGGTPPAVNGGTTINASEVKFDSSNSSLEGTTVQDAIDESEPKLADILVGTWTGKVIRLKSKIGEDGNHFRVDDFTITFNADGSFEAQGPMLAFGWIDDIHFPNYVPDTWGIYNQELSIAYVMNPGEDPIPNKGKIIQLKKKWMKVMGYDDVICELTKVDPPEPTPTPSPSP